jgi:ribosome maturation factor RimP
MRGLDYPLYEALLPLVTKMGYELWGVERLVQLRGSKLRLFIDSPQGITVDDCALVSGQVNAWLEAESIVDGDYLLEISSPGLDRKFFKPEQLNAYLNEMIELTLYESKANRKRFVGKLVQVTEKNISLNVADEDIIFTFAEISKAKVVPQWPSLRSELGSRGKRT